jgi:CHAD domain-containing protein
MAEQQEVERKYDVPLGAVVPDLVVVPGVAGVGEPLELEQVARYYDTADLRLLQARITLRRRVGGVDDGWHLKLPGDGDARREVTVPLGPGDEPVPDELVARVRVHVRDRELVPQTTLTTRRTVHEMLDADGTVLAELCDDEVRAERGSPAETTQAADDVERWREWEVEVRGGAEELIDEVEPLLLGAGAGPAASSSKAARALSRHRPETSWRDRLTLPEDPTVADVLARYLAEHLTALQEQDVKLRGGEEEGVHQLRVAARRTRSALTTYKSVLEDGATEQLRDDLKWLGQVLSDARDAQVARERLLAVLDRQPVELVLGPVAARIDDELTAAFRTGRSRAREELAGRRYFAMLDRLEDFVARPSVAARGKEPAAERLPKLLTKDLQRVRRRDRAAQEAPSPEQREVALHDVRKAAKRLRYAAESAIPVFGDRATELAKAGKAITSLLGDHQDTVVARRLLREMGVRAHLSGENGFTFGRLHGLEEKHAAELLEDYPSVYSALPTKRLRKWLTS